MNNEIVEKLLRVLADGLPWTVKQLHTFNTGDYGLTLEQTSELLIEMAADGTIIPATSPEHGPGFTLAKPKQSLIKDLALAFVKAESLVNQKRQESSLWGHPDTWERPGISHDQAVAKLELLHIESCAAKAALSQATIALTVELCEGNVSPSPERESVSIDISDTSSLVCRWWEDGSGYDGYDISLTLRL